MENGPYITARRARFYAIDGSEVNIPWATPVAAVNGILVCDGKPLCTVTSQVAYDYFARNDDGNGLDRGDLTAAIAGKLSARDENHKARWAKVWEASLCKKHRRTDHEDYWLWSQNFYEAPLEDLQYIAKLIGVRIEEKG